MTGSGRTRDVGVVIVAAGSSSRTGGSAGGELKQFRWVAGKPMLLHSLQAFQQRDDVAMVVCVLPKAQAGDPPPGSSSATWNACWSRRAAPFAENQCGWPRGPSRVVPLRAHS